MIPRDLSDNDDDSPAEVKQVKKRPLHGKRALMNGNKRGKKKKIF